MGFECEIMEESIMKERPISFTARLIPGLLDGSITQTRRTRGLEEINKIPSDWELSGWDESRMANRIVYNFHLKDSDYYPWVRVHCPYGQVGDRLWVRETWGIAAYTAYGIVDVMYKGDEGRQRLDVKHITWFDGLKLPKNCDIWHSPRFMPRWASRIDLEITEVRLERLQEITEEDAIAEGTKSYYTLPGGETTARYHFSALWDFLNAKRGYPWAMNPWPWVLGLRRIDAQ